MDTIVTPEWLHKHLYQPNLILLDASIEATADGKRANNEAQTIPTARPFDLKKRFSAPNAEFPNTFPSADQFETACRELGINEDSQLVIFDKMGVFSSPRAWWLFQLMGHEKVAVLDGGLPEWIGHGFDTTTQSNKATTKTDKSGNFTARFQPHLVVSFEQVNHNITQQDFILVDARSRGRFTGIDSEPRPHLQSGAIPHSVNLPYQEVLSDNTFKPQQELQSLFDNTFTHDDNLAFSCGSGMTACIIMLASRIAGRKDNIIYDGSWTEWAERQGLMKPTDNK